MLTLSASAPSQGRQWGLCPYPRLLDIKEEELRGEVLSADKDKKAAGLHHLLELSRDVHKPLDQMAKWAPRTWQRSSTSGRQHSTAPAQAKRTVYLASGGIWLLPSSRTGRWPAALRTTRPLPTTALQARRVTQGS